MAWLLFLLLIASVALGLVHEQNPHVGLLGAPDVVSFQATPTVASPGQPVTIAWHVRGAASLALDFGPEEQARGNYEHHENLPLEGTMKVQLKQNTRFVLGCETVAHLDCQPAVISVAVKGGAPSVVPIE